MSATKTKTKPAINTATPEAHASIAERLAARRIARENFVREHGLKKTRRIPIVGLVTADLDQELLQQLRTALSTLDMHILELAALEKTHLQVTDIVIFPTTDLARGRDSIEMLSGGAVPVMSEKIAPKLFATEYDPLDESGNSFFFHDESVWAIFAAVVRATETFRFSYDWQGIVRNAMEIRK